MLENNDLSFRRQESLVRNKITQEDLVLCKTIQKVARNTINNEWFFSCGHEVKGGIKKNTKMRNHIYAKWYDDHENSV